MQDISADDLQLWLLLKQGDERAFTLLFEKYHAVLYNYGMKLSAGRPEVVEDAIQELFIDLWRLRGGLTDRVESVRFYLYRSLRRRLHQASKSGATTSLTDLEREDVLSDESYDPLSTLYEDHIAKEQKLMLLVAQLPKRQREVLTLRYLEGFSNQDIARLMEVDEKSIRNCLFKALTSLRAKKEWLIISWMFLPYVVS